MRQITLLLSAMLFSFIAGAQQYLSESFEGAWSGTPAVPSGWFNIHTTATGGSSGTDPLYWAANTYAGSWSSTSYGQPTPAGAADGQAVAWYNDYNAKATQKDMLTTGDIDLSISVNPRVTFFFALNASSGAVLTLRASDDGGNTWYDIQVIPKPGTTWTKVNILIPSQFKVTNARLGFEVTASWGSNDLWLDNVIVEEAPLMSGTFTIDNTNPTGGTNFNNFTDAVIALNDALITGPVIFEVASDQVFVENIPVIIATGTSSNTVTFIKSGSGTNPVINATGGGATSDAGIALTGGDYFTFDGIDVAIASGSALEYGYFIKNVSATNGSTNNTVKNCKITLNNANTSSRAVYQNVATTPTSAGGANSGNMFQNIVIENSYSGIYITGNATYPDIGTQITGCTIGAVTSNNIGNGTSTVSALRLTSNQDVTITGNIVRNVNVSGANPAYGIFLENVRGTSTVSNNEVYNISSTSTSTSAVLYGIRLDVVSTFQATAFNNLIYGFSHAISTPSATVVVRALCGNVGGSAGTAEFYYNSVNISLNAAASSAAFYANGGTLTVTDNIFANFSASGATSKRFSIYRGNGTLTSNYNDYYIPAGTNNFIGYYTADQVLLTDWQTASSQDANSVSIDPVFTVPGDLHPTNGALNNLGIPVSILVDFDGAPRDVSTPDMGAYEFSPAACPAPSALTATSVTNVSADLGWTSNGTETLWNLEWGAGVFTQGTGTLVSGVTGNPYSLSGLSGNTQYSFFIQADCGGGDLSTWSGPFTFTTLCDNISTFPFTESFDGTTFAPDCWTNVKTAGTGNPGIWDRQTAGTNPTCTPHSGAAMARYNCYSLSAGTTGILVTPALDLPTDLYEVRFWMYRDDGYASDPDLVNVYYNTAPNTSGATLLGTINRYYQSAPAEATANQWYEYFFNMPVGSGGTGRYVIFEGVSDFGNNIFVDDVTVRLQPNCPAVSGLTASAVTNGSADLGWTSNGTETLWNIEWGAGTFTQGSGTLISGVTGNPYNLTGLTSNTEYSFFVQADCGGGDLSTWTGPFSFTTLCDNISTFPFVESFDGTTFAPDCWTNVKTAGTGNPGTWDRQTAGTNPTCTPHSGAAMARYNSYSYSTGTTGILVTPALDLPSDLYEVKFWMYRDGGLAGDPDLVNIYYNTTPNTSGATLLGTINRYYQSAPAEATANQWYEYAFNMPVGSGGNGRYVIFEGVSEWGNNIFVDDVAVQLQPTCPKPFDLTATNLTTTDATLSWTPGSTETNWFIEWGLTGFTQGTGTIEIINTSSLFNLTGLSPNTSYSYYVMADCGGGDISVWAGPFTFSTNCAAFDIPYSENFDAVSTPNLPSCMSKTNDNADAYEWVTSSAYPNSSPNSMAISYNSSLAMNDWLYTPALNLLSSRIYSVSFYYRARSASMPEKLEVKWGSNPDAASMLSATLFDDNNIINTTYLEGQGQFTVPSDGIYYVGFHGYSDADQWTLYVDDIMITGTNTESDILTFEVPGQGTTTFGTNTIDIAVCETDVTSLVPTITVSEGATIVPASGVAQDFTNPVNYTVTAEDGVTTTVWTVTVTNNPLPTFTLTSPTSVTLCEGQSSVISATLTGTGPWTITADDGSGPSSFVIPASPFSIPASPPYNMTIQIINVEDANGCSYNPGVSIDFTVHENPVSGTAAAIDQGLCEGESTDINLNGYIGDIQWQISSDGINFTDITGETLSTLNTGSLTSTTYYQAVVSNTNCPAVTSNIATVTVGPAPDVIISGPDSTGICLGETASFTLLLSGTAPWFVGIDDGTSTFQVNASSSPFTLELSPSAFTNYTLINVTDANCQSPAIGGLIVSVTPLPDVTVSAPDSVGICPGETASFSLVLTGTAPWVIDIDDGSAITQVNAAASPFTFDASPSASTVYTITSVTDADCQSVPSGSFTVTVNIPDVVTITENAGTLTSDAPTGNQWYEETLGLLAGETGTTYTPTANGNYYVIVTDANGCTSTSNVISFVLFVMNIDGNFSISLYPNPAADYVTLTLMATGKHNLAVEISSVDGKTVFEKDYGTNGNTSFGIDLSRYSSGMYLIKVQSGSNSVIQKLFVE